MVDQRVFILNLEAKMFIKFTMNWNNFHLIKLCTHCQGHKSEHWNDLIYNGEYEKCKTCGGLGYEFNYINPKEFIEKNKLSGVDNFYLPVWVKLEHFGVPYWELKQYLPWWEGKYEMYVAFPTIPPPKL